MNECHIKAIDGLKLHVRIQKPDQIGENIDCICFVHGLGEHSGRYQELAEFFLKEGFCIVTFDLRGHGRSQGWRGHVSDYQLLMDDIRSVLVYSHAELLPRKTILYGQSMGGNLVINYALRRRPMDDPAVDALVVSSPMLRTARRPPRWKEALGRLLFTRVPWFSLWNGIRLRHLSRDPAVGRRVLVDRRCHPWLSARLGISLVDSGAWALENAKLLERPMLLMHGGDDHVTSCEASREFAERAGDKCTFMIWPDARHELHHDIIRQDVFRAVLDWITGTLTCRTGSQQSE